MSILHRKKSAYVKKKLYCGIFIVFVSAGCLCACSKEGFLKTSYVDTKKDLIKEEKVETKIDRKVQQNKGYDLFVENRERHEAEEDCQMVMEMVSHIYKTAEKGAASNVVILDEMLLQMKEVMKDTRYPIIK